MRRPITIAVALALTAALATPAMGGDDDQLEGFIEKDPGTYLGLNIDRKNGKRFIVDGFGAGPYTCVDGGQGHILFGTGKRVRIRHNDRFSVTQRGDPGRPGNPQVLGQGQRASDQGRGRLAAHDRARTG